MANRAELSDDFPTSYQIVLTFGRTYEHMKIFFSRKDFLRQNQCSNPHLHAMQPKVRPHVGADQTSDFELFFLNALK